MSRSPTSSNLSFGLLLPQEEGPGEPPPTWAYISATARAAEDVGFDSAWLVDHMLWAEDPWERDPAEYGAEGVTGPYGALEAWTTIAALAAVTTRLRLGTLVTCTRYRNPALLAKMADTVHDISGGRLVLGLGGGDNAPEHAQFGYPFERRVSHFAEALEIIAPLLRTGQVDFEGEFYRAHAELRPRSAGSVGPPILIGSLANRPRVLGLVARYADIWNGWSYGATRAEDLAPALAAVDAACAEHGRDPATLARSAVVVVALDGPMARNPDALTGTPDEIAATLAGFRAVGIDELQLRLFPNTLESIEQFGPILERVRSTT